MAFGNDSEDGILKLTIKKKTKMHGKIEGKPHVSQNKAKRESYVHVEVGKI